MARSNRVPFWKDQIPPRFGMVNVSGIYAIWGLLRCVCSPARSCPTLCDPMDCGPPGSSVHRILPAGTLECVAMPSSRGSSWVRDWTHISCISSTLGRFFTTVSPGKPLKTSGMHDLYRYIYIYVSEKNSPLHTRMGMEMSPPLFFFFSK